MPLRRSILPFLITSTLAVILGCVHTPPGTSVEIALARRAEVVRLPATPAPAPGPARETASGGDTAEKTERVADAFSRGEFCMKAGKDAEAIAAFREAVKLDPNFAQAWTTLAALYERTGNERESREAFKHAKLAQQ